MPEYITVSYMWSTSTLLPMPGPHHGVFPSSLSRRAGPVTGMLLTHSSVTGVAGSFLRGRRRAGGGAPVQHAVPWNIRKAKCT